MRILFLLFFTSFFITGTAQQTAWQQQVNFNIDVTVNEGEKTLDGFETITYINNSPDTLTFITFHIWLNAYKNDRTAFNDDMLAGGKTSFYFSGKEQRGYINGLQFKVNGNPAKTENHPSHIDIIYVLLPQPLLPKQQATITTPFHVKLPRVFYRGGYADGTFYVTQWYPKPAVYDKSGWHPMPYLEQGEFYSDFGNYDVRITVPKEYVIAATGELQNKEEWEWIKNRNTETEKSNTVSSTNKTIYKKRTATKTKTSITNEKVTDIKTLRFTSSDIHDFAFFAAKDFVVERDTCVLPSGKQIQIFSYYKQSNNVWKGSIKLAKEALRFYSSELGDYPYSTLSIVEGAAGIDGGMEYPALAVVAPALSKVDFDLTLAHEIGHNWFYGALASNERAHPWLDEGFNTFYEKKYGKLKYGALPQWEELIFQRLARTKKDQPITTNAENFNAINYGAVAYYKTARWLSLLEEKLGQDGFKFVMQQYFQTHQFTHPQPEDFKAIIAPHLGDSTDYFFGLLNNTGLLPVQITKSYTILSPLVPKSITNYLKAPQKKPILLSPAVGFNRYDKAMLGALFTNYLLPPSKLQFIAAPLYGTGSKSLNGLLNMTYTSYPAKKFYKIIAGFSALSFSKNSSLDSNENNVTERFTKLTPYLRFTFNQPIKATKETWIEARSYIIQEKEFSKYVTKQSNNLTYVDSISTYNRYVNSVSFFTSDHRVLYPYDFTAQLQQGQDFYRINFTGNYFFNFAKGGGASVRLFAAKFGYFDNNRSNNFSSFRYQPKLLGNTGEEDYTYSNYFIGRTASFANDGSVAPNNGLSAQQIMVRDGGLKLRIDQYEFLQGRSQDWVAALNFTSALPKAILPIPVPLKLFLDVGTYAESWKEGAETSRFLYIGGLQLSLVKNTVNIYMPIVYSNEFKTYLKTLPEQNTFVKRLTFSIDLHRFGVNKPFQKIFP